MGERDVDKPKEPDLTGPRKKQEHHRTLASMAAMFGVPKLEVDEAERRRLKRPSPKRKRR